VLPLCSCRLLSWKVLKLQEKLPSYGFQHKPQWINGGICHRATCLHFLNTCRQEKQPPFEQQKLTH
jgi:hypothetical protein